MRALKRISQEISFGRLGLLAAIEQNRRNTWASMSAASPLYRFSALRLMSASVVEAKTFDNYLGFERGLSQRQTKTFASVPKTSVLARILEGPAMLFFRNQNSKFRQ